MTPPRGGPDAPGAFPGKRVLILGLPYFGAMLESQLRGRGWRARFVPHPARDLRAWARVARMVAAADLVYLIGSRAERGSPQDIMMRFLRKPVVIHWVGTDVLIAQEEHRLGRLASRVVDRPTHWTDAGWLVEELAAMGIRAEYVPLPIPGLAPAPLPLPDEPHVLLYLPVDAFDREVFDMETLIRLPAAFPDVAFTLVPSPAETLPGPPPPNLATPGWTDLTALWPAISVYVRLTSHDGVPFTVVEALSRGRHVIFTHTMPHTIRASGFNQVSAALGQLIGEQRAGRLMANDEGAAWARATFAPVAALDEIDRRLRALTGA